MSDIKAVIFDLDGTLYNYNKADASGVAALGEYTERHFGVDAGEIRREIKRCWDIQNERIGFICASTHSRLVRSQVICETNGWPVFPHSLNMARLYWEGFLAGMEAEDGVCEFLAALRKTGVDIAIGSNMTSYMQYRKILQIDLQDAFDHFTFSEETGLEKPHRKFYELCARKSYLRYDPTGTHDAGASTLPDISFFMPHCLFIGDTPKMDYFGPMNAGMQSCLYLTEGSIPEGVSPDSVIRSYRDCIKEDGIKLGTHFLPFIASDIILSEEGIHGL